MRSTGIDRRAVLRIAATLGIGGLGIGPLGHWAAGRRRGPVGDGSSYVAARQEADGRHVVAVFDSDTEDRVVVALPGRGHDVAISPRAGLFVVFARRPGRFAVAVQRAQPPVAFKAPDDRHFYGHGCFSPSGDLLYATENDFRRGRGVIGIYRSPGRLNRDWRRVGEFSTYGCGPHGMLLLADGRTLAVANGGILTDPNVGDGRTRIGGGVRADLVLIDRQRGERLGQWRLPPDLAELSIRHLALDGGGNLWFGCQWEGPADAKPPLLGRLTTSGTLQMLETSIIDGNLANYIGSVAADRSGTLIAASSPRSGAVAIVDAAAARILAVAPLTDGCGLAGNAGGRGFIATSGGGRVEMLRCVGKEVIQQPLRDSSARWDNHLRRLGA